MTIGDIVKKYRADNRVSVREFAEKTGLSSGYVSMIENGINPRSNKPISPTIPSLKKVAQGLDTDLDGLLRMMDEGQEVSLSKTEPEAEIPDNVYPIKQKKLRLLGEIACGEPIFCNEERESYVIAGTDIDADFCLKAKGDSMINARILDGDIVFIREQSTVENGDIAAVIIEDEATLKRIYFDGTTFTLIAENPKYHPMIFTGETLNHVRILGKAIAFQSDVI